MIKSFIKCSTVDYPGKLVATAFLGGCNLNCEYCHNSLLIKNSGDSLDLKGIIDFLKGKINFLDGLCISGGEPTIHGEKLVKLIKLLKKELGQDFLIKVDSNGTNPDLIKELLPLIDYISLDFKTLDYENNLGVDKSKIIKSYNLIKTSNIAYDVRITIYPGYIKISDADLFAELLKEANRVYIQNYEKNYKADYEPYNENDVAEFVDSFLSKGINVIVR